MKAVPAVVLAVTILNTAAQALVAICPPFGGNQQSIISLQNDDGNTDDTIGIFLNLDEPVTCQGTAKTWHYCFHIPSNNLYPNLQAEFGVYRRQGDRYNRVANSRIIVIVSAVNPSPACFSANVFQPFTVFEGDVIGACIPRGFSRTHGGLDILGYSSGQQLYQPSDAGICDFVADSVDISDFIPTGAGIAMQLHLELDSTSHCTVTCQDIPTNNTIDADPTSSYTTMIDTSTLLHDVGSTNIGAITPTTTLLMSEMSDEQRVSSTVAPHEVSSNTPPPVRQATSTILEVVSDKPSSSIKHQGVTVEQSNLLTSILTSSVVLEENDLPASTSASKEGTATSILTPSLVLEESDMSESTSGLSVGTIAGIAAAAVFLLGLALISVIFIAYRRRRNHYDTPATKVVMPAHHEQNKMCINQFYESQKLVENHAPNYYDPATTEEGLYAQINEQKLKVIQREALEISLPLGTGNFGVVDRAIWTDSTGMVYEVAVKSLSRKVSASERTKLLQEAAIMGQFRHPNVLKLYGIVLQTDLIMLVSEIAHNGDLKKYLKTNYSESETLETQTQLFKFCIDIAKGMHYLSSKGFVHRDLAARNVLLTTGMTCKIADFGMSRDLRDHAYYVSQNNLIPIKWTAPEAVYYRKYSSASDVWSFGCLLYEIWTIGHDPYEDLHNSEVLLYIAKGCGLEPPPGCPAVISELMRHCWYMDTHLRPSFRDIVTTLVFKGGKFPLKMEASTSINETETDYYNVAHTYLQLSAFRH